MAQTSSSETNRLPRGPHSLSPEEVAASQRARLVDALTEIAADVGIDATRIADVCRRAGVSNNAFYAHFDNKAAAFLAAYEQIAEAVADAVVGAFAPDRPWRDFVRDAIGAYLDALAASPSAAKLFLVESAVAPREVRDRRRARFHETAELIRLLHDHARTQEPALAPAPAGLHLAVVHGITGLVAEQLADGSADGPLGALDTLCQFVISVFAGLEDER